MFFSVSGRLVKGYGRNVIIKNIPGKQKVSLSCVLEGEFEAECES